MTNKDINMIRGEISTINISYIGGELPTNRFTIYGGISTNINITSGGSPQ